MKHTFSSEMFISIPVNVVEKGYCVKTGGRDQNAGVIRLDSKDGDTTERQNECLKLCQSVSGATGCELIFGQKHKGCFAHTQEVVSGKGGGWHYCWIFSNHESELTMSNIKDGEDESKTTINKECEYIHKCKKDITSSNSSPQIPLSNT